MQMMCSLFRASEVCANRHAGRTRPHGSREIREPTTSSWDPGTEPLKLSRTERIEDKCDHDRALVEYMRTAALPVIEPFYGGEKQSFKRIVKSFTIRYHNPQRDDKSLIQVFESFLTKKALVALEAIPSVIKESTFEEVIQL